MTRTRVDNQSNGALDPFPEGWYFVATRKAVQKAKLIQRTWLGQEIVIWCDGDGQNGQVCVAESYCPHLGSPLGPEAGGQVRDGCLVCPFHGFEFDASGQCVNTPFAPPPRTARLKVFPTQEILGLVFAWWGIGGRPPQWQVGEIETETGEWGDVLTTSFRFPGHPQETTENSVDLAHLRYVHGYDSVHRVDPVSIDGAYLLSRFNFRRPRTIAGIRSATFEVSVDTHIHGLGYSFVEIREHTIGMSARLWVLATPVDGNNIELVLASQMHNIRKPKRLIVGLGFVPMRLRRAMLNRIMLAAQRRDVTQDVIIWRNKQFRNRPRLCRSDGEIGVYRRYCEQFYPDSPGESVQKRFPSLSLQA